MLSFPLDLIPSHVKLTSIPKYRRAQMTPHDAFFKSSLLLSNTTSGGTLDLIFKNYPTKPVNLPCKPNNFGNNPDSLVQIGWVGAWQFYHEQTKDGHLCFTIPANHKIWQRIDYDVNFKAFSLDALNSIWRIDTFTNDNSETPKQTTNFNIVISAEIRTPSWV
jgi:hypothetical protein